MEEKKDEVICLAIIKWCFKS